MYCMLCYVMWPVNVFHRLVSTRAGWRSRFDEIVFHSYYSLIGELFQRLWKYQDLAGNVLIKSYRTVVGIRAKYAYRYRHQKEHCFHFADYAGCVATLYLSQRSG